MLSQSQRTAILELHAQGVSKREIARALNLSRLSVRKVLRSKSPALPLLVRPEKAEAYRIQILELLASHKGNLVRVHEELVSRGAEVSYPALTAFCRRHGIGQEPKVATGHYHFEPGEELQHDTSPHETEIAGNKRRIQTASAVLCYSRMVFFQCYPTFQRFDCKVFLTDALRYFGGSTARVMIDNTHVVVLRGTGAEMVPVPEMEAFGDRFGFRFAAHERGDANRSARVERPFHFIDGNFLAGRTFSSWEDLNQQARQWCDRVNSTYKKHIRAVPRELFAVERSHLKPLPVWIPEVYRLHERIVDVEGYVALHSSRYSVPVAWIGRRAEVRETKDKLEIQLDPRHIVSHQRVPEGEYQRITLAEHRPPRGRASNALIRIRKNWRFSGPLRNSRTIWPHSKSGATVISRLPCANCCGSSANIRASPSSPLSPMRPVTASLTWIGSNAWSCAILLASTFYSTNGKKEVPMKMNEELEQLLKNLKLRRILDIYDEQLRAAEKEDVSYSEFLTRLMRAQWPARQEQALEWRIRNAKLPERWSLDTFPFARQPSVNRKQIRTFAELDFVTKKENIVFIGPTGVGKSDWHRGFC